MTKEDKRLIRFRAEVSKVSTLADGGIRITLDISESEIETAKKMMEARQAGAILEIVAVPVEYGKTD
jgi:sigma54-dependent transcription regulator